MLVDIFFEPEVAQLDALGPVLADVEDAAGIIVDVAVGEAVAGEMHRIAPGEGELGLAAGVAQQMIQPVIGLPAARHARMDDRLADQHIGKDVGAERAGEELAAMAADRPARLLRHREVGAADRDPAIGEILPDLIGDIEMGLEPEALGGRGEGRGRGGGQQQALQHGRSSP